MVINKKLSEKLPEGTEISGDSGMVKYRVEKWLGEGEEGQVYRVQEDYSGGERVLKLLFPDVFNKKKYVKEYSKKLGKLSSVKGIPRFYHAGYWDKKRSFFMVMEYVSGETLDELTEDSKRFPLFEALTLTRDLLETLDECHKESICLGDLSLSNIMYDEKSGQVTIIDFLHDQDYSPKNIQKDIASVCKLFYAIIGDKYIESLKKELQMVLPHKKTNKSAGEMLNDLLVLMGEDIKEPLNK